MNRFIRRGFLGALAGSAAGIPLLFLSTAGAPEFAVAIVAGSMPQYVKDTPSSRVLLVGSSYDADCRGIRSFLSANRVQYDWVDSELELERASSLCAAGAPWGRCGRRRYDAPTDSDGPRGRRGVGPADHAKGRAL
jgi:hypothetical protein